MLGNIEDLRKYIRHREYNWWNRSLLLNKEVWVNGKRDEELKLKSSYCLILYYRYLFEYEKKDYQIMEGREPGH